MSSKSSSEPPSSGGYVKPAPKSRRRRSGKKVGKQPGAPGKNLPPVADPDEVVDRTPDHCEACGDDLSDAPVTGEIRRQLFDLPPVTVATTIPCDPARNARTDVASTPYSQDPSTGEWVFDGTVRSSSTRPRGCSIVVDFVNSVATVQDTKTISVPTLAPGKTTSWSVSGAKGEPKISCVIRQVQTVNP